jgi:hypothetical protein
MTAHPAIAEDVNVHDIQNSEYFDFDWHRVLCAELVRRQCRDDAAPLCALARSRDHSPATARGLCLISQDFEA